MSSRPRNDALDCGAQFFGYFALQQIEGLDFDLTLAKRIFVPDGVVNARSFQDKGVHVQLGYRFF